MKNPITVVRQRIAYDFVVMEREDLNSMSSLDMYDTDMKPIGDEDLGRTYEKYIAFEGDVSSYTDDMIFSSLNRDWTDVSSRDKIRIIGEDKKTTVKLAPSFL